MHFDEEEISVSEKACFLPGATAHRHDVVLFAMDEEKGVGQIQMFAKIGLANYACLHLWDPCGVNSFTMRSKPVMVPLDAIRYHRYVHIYHTARQRSCRSPNRNTFEHAHAAAAWIELDGLAIEIG